MLQVYLWYLTYPHMSASECKLDDPKPPGFTCPYIEGAIGALRKLHWRAKNERRGDEDEILAEGIRILERIRSDNRQMRAAWRSAVEKD